MEEVYARLSKGGRVLCGREDVCGCYTCDEPLAEVLVSEQFAGPAARCLIPPDGWKSDRKGIWRRTTQVEDRRRYGRLPGGARQAPRPYPALPTLVCCPKCKTVQWLEPARLKGVSCVDWRGER